MLRQDQKVGQKKKNPILCSYIQSKFKCLILDRAWVISKLIYCLQIFSIFISSLKQRFKRFWLLYKTVQSPPKSVCRTFLSPRKLPCDTSSHFSTTTLLQTLETAEVSFTCSWTSYKLNHTVCTFLGFTPLTQHVFTIHPKLLWIWVVQSF